MGLRGKIPILAGAAILLAGFLALFFFVRPPEEDLLVAAARRHAETLGPVRDVQLHGTMADILLDPDGRCIFAEFARRDGRWAFVKDVGREFVDQMRTPEKEREVLGRLGKRLSDQLRVSVTLREGLTVEIQVSRDERGILGQYYIGFAFPKSGEQEPQRGRYIENYRYENGGWSLEGLGRLILSVPKK